MILCLETATDLCSVALCDENGVISLRESRESKSHATLLTVFIEEILRDAGIGASGLDAVAVSKGPGSYTGLRIGVSVAKGIAFSVSIPLIALETTESMVHGLLSGRAGHNQKDDNTLFCPMLDARRMEIYYAIYDSRGNNVKGISAEIITPDTFNNIPASREIVIFGDGAAKCTDVLKRPNITFASDFKISASYMQKPVMQAFEKKHFEDVAYFEPLYLKDFITSQPRKNIVGNQ
jgi:tRNA threonylcarbamoyladenosine biosynthesis protein TsaB